MLFARSPPLPPAEPSQRQNDELRASPRGPNGSSFVPGLVHELRNFSFGISGSLDALEARFGRTGDVAKYQTVMRASLDRLNAFLDELGDYGDPRPLLRVEGSLEMLLREAMEQHQGRAREAGVELRLVLEGPLPPVRADERGLCLAFTRLIGLALGRAPRGGQVLVRASAREGQLITGCVESPGMELPGVDLARLFEPFYYRASGFGRLALPVARRVLEGHGGSLAAVRGPGAGVRLAFTLPALAPPS